MASGEAARPARRARVSSAARALTYALALATLGCASGGRATAPARAPAGEIELLGVVEIPSGFEFAGTVVGGLSGLTYDAGRRLYYAVSDDPAEHGPARFYSLRIDLGDGRLDPGDVAVVGVTPLRDGRGEPFAPGSIDAEGIALVPGTGGAPDNLFISSEGKVDDGVPPFVRRFDLDGRQRGSLPLPPYFLPAGAGAVGVRHNLAFESLTASPDGSLLLTAAENALVQDGPRADLGTGSPARLLVYDLATGGPAAEYVYPVDPVTLPSRPADGFRVGGLVELVALERPTLLALERAYSAGAGHAIKLYRVSLAGATDVSGRARLFDAGADRRPATGSAAVEPAVGDTGSGLRPAAKTAVADLAALLAAAGVASDNLEGMALGPPLADGRRPLIVVADDNFSSRSGGGQRTLFLALALPESL